MRKLVAIALVAALVSFGGVAEAAKVWDDMSWWGNTGATPEPVQDSKGRSGYWWWPTVPASNVNDQELWGNRGIVYHAWERPAPPVVVTPEPPRPADPPAPERQVIMLNNVLFDFDKAVLKPEGRQEVDKLVDEMKAHGNDAVVIVGHTCDIGAEAYNMGLGQRRADAVRNYMIQMGIDPARITAISRGETQPAVPNDSAANRKLNRRATFDITLGS